MKDFLSLQSPHKARTISRHPIGLTEARTHSQLEVKDKDLAADPSSHALSCAFSRYVSVDPLFNSVPKY